MRFTPKVFAQCDELDEPADGGVAVPVWWCGTKHRGGKHDVVASNAARRVTELCDGCGVIVRCRTGQSGG